jgi:hypothetical protein
MRIFLDESGFTGEDLFNEAQPVFVLASTVLPDSEGRRIQVEVFGGVHSRELKHSALARTPKGRKRVLDFVRVMRASKATAATYVVHKRFCLLAKLVDLWVESAMHDTGFDFYKDGACLAFTNLCYYCLRTFESDLFLRNTIRRFQVMMRERTRRAYDSFWSQLRRKMRTCRDETKELLFYFDLAERILGPPNLLSLPERSLDISVTAAHSTLHHWRSTTDEESEVIHDNSSVMAKEKWIWDAIVAPDVPKKSFRFGDEIVKYPLNVSKTVLEDSANFVQLQLSDVLAGATRAWAGGLIYKASSSQYFLELEEAGIREFLIGGVWPTPDVSRRITEGASDLVEFTGRVVSRSLARGST